MSGSRVPLIPDLEQADRFLGLLDETAEVFCFQTFDDSPAKREELARTIHGSLAEVAAELGRLNSRGAGVFVAVNEVPPGRRRLNENVSRIRAVFEDQDKAGSLLPSYPIEPHIMVESSAGKRHAYWLVDGLELGGFYAAQKGVAAFCGSDISVCDKARVMRLPGFWHVKKRPYMAKITRSESALQAYSAEAVTSAFPPPASTMGEAGAVVIPDGLASSSQVAAARKIAFDAARRTHDDPGLSRHLEIVRMGHFLRRDGIPMDSEVLNRVLTDFSEHMRPADTTGASAAMNWRSATKALTEAYNIPSEGDRPRPRPVRSNKRHGAPPPGHPAADTSVPDYGDPSAEASPPDYGQDEPALKVVAGTDHDPRPTIQVKNGDLPAVTDQAEAALRSQGVDLYQHGNRLVRVGKWEAKGGPVHRPAGAGVLIDVGPDWLVDKMTRIANWERFDGRSTNWVSIDAPMKVAKTLLARTGEWPFSHLIGFCDAPTLDLSGRVVSRPGYDESSGLYLSSPPIIEEIGNPTKEDAREAGHALYELVSTFPFKGGESRSAALSVMMTVLLRRVLPAAPMCCVSASTPGTGKSLFVDCVSALATGRKASVTALGRDGEELEKRLDSILLKGDAVCALDNVDRAVKSDVLCQVTTQSHKSIRVLAQSKIVETPTNVALMMTGNNLTLIGDLTRRAVMVHMDAGCERPERREFSRDAIGHVLKFRAEGIRNALIISKAYSDAGSPKVDAMPFGSFEDWDRMIRRPLIWTGWKDPLAAAEGLRGQDHEYQGMADLMRSWLELFGGAAISAAELYENITSNGGAYAGGGRSVHPALSDAAVTVMGNPGRWGSRELGYKLRSWSERIVEGHKVVSGGRGRRGVKWKVVKV